MKTKNTMPDEEVISPDRRMTSCAPARAVSPPEELPLPPRRRAIGSDIRKRLEILGFRERFYQPVDITSLATTWASHYVSQVFPHAQDDQQMRLLLAAEAGFLASIKLGKCGIGHWERLLEAARKRRDEFGLK